MSTRPVYPRTTRSAYGEFERVRRPVPFEFDDSSVTPIRFSIVREIYVGDGQGAGTVVNDDFVTFDQLADYPSYWQGVTFSFGVYHAYAVFGKGHKSIPIPYTATVGSDARFKTCLFENACMRNGKTGEAKASRREFLKGVSTPVVLSGDWVRDEDGGFWSDLFGDDGAVGDVEVYGGLSKEKEEVYPDGKGLFFAYDEDAWYKQKENEYEWKLSTIGGGGSSNWKVDTDGNLTPKDNEPVSVDELSSGRQNSNNINLTHLVNDGTYSDILDAIANAPPTYPTGTTFVIEPGTYQSGTPQSITWSNRTITVAGEPTAANWTPDREQQPVVIEWTGADADTPLTFDTSNSTLESIRFRGITFRPETAGNGTTAIHFDASSNDIRNVEFDHCTWDDWGGGALDTTHGGPEAYDFDFHRCGIRACSGQAGLPKQTYWNPGCFIQTGNSTGTAASFGNLSYVSGVIGGANGNDGITISSGCKVIAKNFEGDGATAGQNAIVVDHTGNPAQIFGSLGRWDIPVYVANGSVHTNFSTTGTETVKVRFQATANNDHNGSRLFSVGANYDFENATTQQIVSHASQDDANVPTNPPVGFKGYSQDADGAGTPGWLKVDRTGTIHYITETNTR